MMSTIDYFRNQNTKYIQDTHNYRNALFALNMLWDISIYSLEYDLNYGSMTSDVTYIRDLPNFREM